MTRKKCHKATLIKLHIRKKSEKFNKKALEIEVDKEVEEERQYFEDMGYDNPDGEGM